MYRRSNAFLSETAGAACVAVRAVVLAVCALLATSAGATPGDEQLERFLTRLGLIELQTLHLEQVLADEGDETRRLELARRLADVYAGQLLASSDDADRYDAVVRKINALLERVPAAKTPLLEVMLLQADYYRAEGLVGKWIADRSDLSSRNDAQAILDRIAPELNRLQTELGAQREKLQGEINKLDEGEQLALKEQELDRLQAIVGRASYFAAWSNYYRGLTKKSTADYEAALKLFRVLLDVGDSYEDVQAENLGLESIWRSRALIGLALTEAALDHAALSDRCFEWLQHPTVPLSLRDQASYWRLQSLLNLERYGEAVTFAEQEVAAFAGPATQSQVTFCVGLIQAAYASGTATNPQVQRLGALGLGGLIKIGQRGTAMQLMAKYKIELGEDAGFYLRWLQGQQLFEQAERTKNNDDYAQAAANLSAALRDPAARDDLGATGQCRNQLAWCHYRLGNYEDAGREFQLAAERLSAARDERAVESAWMAFASFHAASKSAPRLRDAAIDMLNMLKREFPEHEYAKRADYYIGKLRQSTSPAETLRSLEAVPADSPDYLTARYEIPTILFQQWNEAAPDARQGIAQRLFDATETYLKLSDVESDKARLVKTLNQAAHVALGGATPNAEVATKHLARAGSLATSLPESSSAVAEYHFEAMQLARLQGDMLQERLHAGWLVDNAPGSRYELAAIIVMARAVDKKIAASDAAREDLLQAFDLYRRLVELLGDSPESIRANKNAQVANSKLAEYADRLGRHDLAAERLNALLQASEGPPSESYLRRAGLASFAAQDYEASINHWRLLVRGLAKGSDDWFEAKYYQLACLFELDADQARVALEQFKLLYPDLGPAAWREKFQALH